MSDDIWQDIYTGNEEAVKQAAEELKRKMSNNHRQKIIKSLESNGELLMLEDGYLYYAPSKSGAISAKDLRIIADELDRRNQEWNKQVQQEIGGEQ